ncbi:MAG: hypothetical protein OEU86_02335 [Gammaproteobacteria bacterium]|nr:hypothetical protein [Gammaproteobacteria bacterium]
MQTSGIRKTRALSAPLTMLLLTLHMIGGTAHAALQIIEEALELRTTQVMSWPLQSGNAIVVKTCDDCETKSLLTSSATRYSAGFGEPEITLKELLRIKDRGAGYQQIGVMVFYDPDTLTVTRLILDIQR